MPFLLPYQNNNQELLIIFSSLITLTLTILILYKTNRHFAEHLRKPPGPPRLPVIGNLHQLGDLPHRSLHRLSTVYGPLMLLKLGQIPTLVVSSPALAKQVLQVNDLSFCTRPALTAFQKLSYGGLDIAFGPYSDQWRRLRKLAIVEFFNNKRVLQSMQLTREKELAAMMSDIAAASTDGKAVNMSKMLLSLVTNVMCVTAFGKTFMNFEEMMAETVRLMGGFVAGDFFPCMQYVMNFVFGVQKRMDTNFKEMDEFLEKGLKEKENGDIINAQDFASVLVRMGTDEGFITRQHMKAVLMVDGEVNKTRVMRMDIDEDDGHQRTGTVWTAATHAITAVIGSGVLALPWSVAQMGWIMGPFFLVTCAYVTYYTAILLTDCYRTPDPVKGRRNHTYMDVVRSCLGPRDVLICGIAQYTILWGTMIGYIVTAATSIMAVVRSNCFHYKGHDAKCGGSGTLYIIIFGLVEMVLSQLPNLEKITFLSVVAAIMSFTYALIALLMSVVKFASHHSVKGTLMGVKVGSDGVSASTKSWHSFQALGNIAFAYTYAMLLIEIQDTVKSPPPENVTMKRATLYGIGVTSLFYVSLGCFGYAAFGNEAPGNVLTGFYEPFWIVDIANIAVFIHLVGAFQVYAQPIFAAYENFLAKKFPDSPFFHRVYRLRIPFCKTRALNFTLCKLLLRSVFIAFTTLISLMLPFFNAILGFLGSVAFWPLTVYYPVSVYMVQTGVKRGGRNWIFLQMLSVAALIVSLLAAVGSVADIAQRLKNVKIFETEL